MSDTPDEGTQHHASTYEAMVAVMRDIDAIAKTRVYEGQGGYKFRGIEELLDALAPTCRRNGLLTVPSSGTAVMGTYPTRSGGQMNHCLLPVTVTFRATPDPDDVIVASGMGEASDAGDKAASKAYSVGYREIMFKTFVVPVRGGEYDTEQTGDAVNRASEVDIAVQREAQALAHAQRDGWTDPDERDAAWEDFKDLCKSEGQSGEWIRQRVKDRGLKKSMLTAGEFHLIEEVMSHAKKDGDWTANYSPGAPDA